VTGSPRPAIVNGVRELQRLVLLLSVFGIKLGCSSKNSIRVTYL